MDFIEAKLLANTNIGLIFNNSFFFVKTTTFGVK